jgi:hypothetical protein
LSIFYALSMNAQIFGTHHEEHDHEHEHPSGHHHKHEIAIANAAVYFLKEKIFSYGLHAHYVYNFPNSKFGLGVAYERIFDEHKHNTFGIVGSYRPIEPLSFLISPGFTFEGEESSHLNFAFHFETSYEFQIKNFHIGPIFEIAVDPEDTHLSLGLHIGYGF